MQTKKTSKKSAALPNCIAMDWEASSRAGLYQIQQMPGQWNHYCQQCEVIRCVITSQNMSCLWTTWCMTSTQCARKTAQQDSIR
eukprot:scaffold14765_cov448-Alexandrium_tamarense.AAC.1